MLTLDVVLGAGSADCRHVQDGMLQPNVECQGSMLDGSVDADLSSNQHNWPGIATMAADLLQGQIVRRREESYCQIASTYSNRVHG